MGFVLWFPEDLFDDPGFIDHKGGAVQSHVLSSVQIFFAPYTIEVYDLFFRIRNQCKRELELGDKVLMAPAVVRADADHGKALLNQFGVVVPQIASLDRACRCIVFRVKKEYDLFSFQIGQRKLLSILVKAAEQWGSISR